jgi:ABC-type glycerol-3-phosphate transport system substrate-binding protein
MSALDHGLASRRTRRHLVATPFLTLALAACATGGSAGGAARPGGAGSGATASKSLPPATLAMFSNWGNPTQRAAQEKALELFQQQNPGLTVELTTGAANADKVLSAITAGVAPHLVTQNPQRLIPLAGKGTWRALEDLLKTSNVVKREHYADAQLKLLSWKGKLYAIPGFEHFGGYALGYNVEHFQEVGLDTTKPPATPQELTRAQEQLTRVEGGVIKRLGLDPRDAAGGSLSFWAYAWGAPWWDPDTLKLQLNHPTIVELNDFIASFYWQDRAAQIAEFRKQYAMWAAANSGIALGTQSMQISGYYLPGELSVLPQKPAKMGYSWWPNPKREKVYIAQGWGSAIPAENKQVDHAWRLAEHFTTVPAAQIMFDGIGWLNGSKQFLKDGKFDAVPDLRFFLDMPAKADRTVGNYTPPIQSDIDAEYSKGINEVIAGQTSVKAMLDDLQTRMKELLDPFVR